jgi:peptide chain release factor subunit 1
VIRHEEVERILAMGPSESPVLSFYLNTHLGRRSLDEQRIAAKSLFRERKLELEARHDHGEDWKRLALSGLERLEEIVLAVVDAPHAFRGVAAFSCPADGFEQVFRLPQPVKDALIVDHTPYVRPLTAILDEYHRICTLLIDRERAELYEVYMGEILHHAEVFDEVPGRVRIAGWYGLEERRIERHVEDHVRRHFRRVAEILFRLFRRLGFDWLVLGGHHEVIADFRPYLHPYLASRVIREFHAEPGETPVAVVLERTRAIEEATEREEEKKLVRELLDRAQSGGLGVVGLAPTLSAVVGGQVHTLVVEEGFSTAGVLCRRCGFLGVSESLCPVCGDSTTRVPDIVDEAVEATIHYGGRVEHVFAGSELSAFDHMGALLRFRLPEKAKQA